MTEVAKKVKKPAKPAEHPKYSEMVLAAVAALKERTGSSRQAILKYIAANYAVGENASVHLKQALKRMVISKAILQPKGTGASGSFKLNKDKEVKPKKKVVKKPAAKKAPKKPAAKKATKKPVAKKTKSPKKTPKKATKKPAEVKPKAKKPAAKSKLPAKKAAAKKPVKKPAAKKAAKPAAKKASKSPKKK